MTAITDDGRILTPPLPSLCHLSTVSVALPLFNSFDIRTLNKAFAEIQQGNAPVFVASPKGGLEISCVRAKEKLLLIPPHLRKSVLEAIHGLKRTVERWEYMHSSILKFKDGDHFLQWKSYGRIDTVKVVKKLVLNKNINIRKRFEIACKYCLEDSVKTLWAELQASGKTKFYKVADSLLVRFWVRWLHEGSRLSWAQAAAEYLVLPQRISRTQFPGISGFYTSLRPEERKKFWIHLQRGGESYDNLLCLYSMAKEEQEEFMKGSAFSVLSSYLSWPLQRYFLETAEKLHSFINAGDFLSLLRYIAQVSYKEDFEYKELFREFWNQSPDHFKIRALKDRFLKRIVESYIDKIKSKENNDTDGRVNSKRKATLNTDGKRKRTRRNERL